MATKRTQRLLEQRGLTEPSLDERSILTDPTSRPALRAERGDDINEGRAIHSPKVLLPAWQTTNRHVGVQRPDSFDNLSAPNVIRYREASERKMREDVPRRIKWLLREYFNFDPMPFHVEILEQMFKGGKWVINLPTDHAKSLISSYWFPLLSLMNDPDESHIICGANIQDSKRRVDSVRRALSPDGFVGDGLSNARLLEDYPWIGKPGSRLSQWSALELNVVGRTGNKPNPSLRAVAAGSADIRGRRGKLVMDDLEGQKHRHSPTERTKLYDFIKLEAIRCYEDAHESSRPLICALGTPFDVDSIYFRLESQDWQVRRYAFQHEDGSYLWPAKHDKIWEFRKTMTEEEFSIAFRMDPKGGDKSILSYQEIARLAAEAVPDFSEQSMPLCQRCGGSGKTLGWLQGRYQYVRCDDCRGSQRTYEPTTMVVLDPATGSRTRKADYAGITVQRVMWAMGDELPRVEIFEAMKFTMGMYEQVRVATALATKYQCDIVYEANGQQGNNYAEVTRNLLEAREIPDVVWHRWYTTGKNKMWDRKLDPESLLKTLLRESRLLVPESKQDDEGVRTLFSEIRDLGSNAHDHIAMAVWMGIRWAYEHKSMNRAGQIQRNPYAPSFGSEYFQKPGIQATRRFGWR